MRILAIGDIGVVNDMMHIGDEAMFEEFLVQARQRGLTDVVGVSSNPAETSARYGIESVSGTDAAAALNSADAFVITGAGNLASTWPGHILTRAALGSLAAARGIPVAITGQTLGPRLDPEHEGPLGELLRGAAVVGVREAASHAVALRLGVDPGRLHQGADDASFLGLAADGLPALEPTVLVSLSTHVGASDRDGFLDSVAALLDELASHSGLVTSFLAHFGPLAEPWRRGDVVMHEEVAARMSSATRTVATGTSVAAAQAARAAQLVVTSRYHPAVFATSAGTPTVGIAVDDYTTVKLTGALRNLGQDAVIDAEQLLAGASAVPVWERREAIRARGLVVAGERQRESSAWWDRLFGALRP